MHSFSKVFVRISDAEGSNSVTLYGDELPGALILDTLKDNGRFNVFNKDIFITFRTDQVL